MDVGGDCNDADASVQPTEWYADADGDGYGDPDQSVFSCEQPAEHVDNASDCNDADAAIAPGVDEICDDDIDNDCDGDVDSRDAGPGDVAWHVDGDGDGFASA